MQPLKRNLLSMALASATLMLANAASAQAAGAQQNADDAKELDTIEVTGIRRSIEASTDTKREATSIVEAVSAEDIGKLPDTSIADSIARPVSVTRNSFCRRSRLPGRVAIMARASRSLITRPSDCLVMPSSDSRSVIVSPGWRAMK